MVYVRKRVREYEIEVKRKKKERKKKKREKVYHRCVEGTKGKTRWSLEVPVSHETVRLSQGQKQKRHESREARC